MGGADVGSRWVTKPVPAVLTLRLAASPRLLMVKHSVSPRKACNGVVGLQPSATSCLHMLNTGDPVWTVIPQLVAMVSDDSSARMVMTLTHGDGDG
jgi:hypothetical protein